MSASQSVTPRLYAETRAVSCPKSRTTSTHVFQNVLAAIEVLADFLTCAFGVLAAYFVASSLYIGKHTQYPLREAAAVGLGVSLFTVIFLQRDGAYRGSSSLLQIRDTERAIRIPIQSMLIMLPFSLLLRLRLSTVNLLLVLVLIPSLLLLQKQASAAVIRRLRVGRSLLDRVIVYGIGDKGKRILSTLSHSARFGFSLIAVISEDTTFDDEWMPEMGYRQRRSIPVQRGPITSAMLTSCRCSTLIVALLNLSAEQISAAVDAGKQAGSRVIFLSATELQEQRWTTSIDIDGISLTPMLEAFEAWPYSIAKRAVDLISSSLLLVLLAPLFFLIALLIRLDSSGPSLFVQERVGRNGKLFKMY